MLGNLISNAIRRIETGWVRIEGRVVQCDEAVAVLEFAVADSGIGIPENRRHRLFQPFSQVDSSTTRQFGGTGLGLSIIRSLATAMGGEVGVESEPGSGSRFWFRIQARLLDAGTDTRRTPRRARLKMVLAINCLSCTAAFWLSRIMADSAGSMAAPSARSWRWRIVWRRARRSARYAICGTAFMVPRNWLPGGDWSEIDSTDVDARSITIY